MTGLAMLRIVAIVCLSALTIRGELLGQERLKAIEEEYDRRIAEYAMSEPEYPQGAQVDAHEGDSLALVALYNATGGPSTWKDRSGWLQEPVSEWHGITLDSTGRVTRVNLKVNNLVGQLSSSIGELARLEELDLHGNKLSENLPAELGQLSELRRLRLSYNGFSGGIPPSLGQLAKLDWLDMNHSNLTGPIPPELGQLKELSFMWLSYNRLSGEIPVELAQMTKMEELHFTGNRLTGQIPEELGQMANLKYLWLSYNSLSGTIPSELRNLEKIGLNGNNLSGPIPTHLGEWENLIDLYLCDNNFSGQIPQQLGQLSKLEWLCLGDNHLSGSIPAELGQLASLRHLWLQGNDLSNHIPRELGQLSQLKELYLHDNQFFGPLPDWTSLSGLDSVRVHANQFMFADLLPNAALSRIPTFVYAPQDSIDTQLNCTTSEFVLTTPATAEANKYKWYRDGTAMPNEDSNSLRVNRTASPAVYHASIINDALPKLTLVSRKRHPHVATSCPAGQFAHVGDSLALVAFYNATGGPDTWIDRSGWLQAPVSEWFGISLDAAGRVRYIQIRGNNLSGALPSELGDLANLEELSLGRGNSTFNSLTGTIPPELGQLANLKVLQLNGNKLEGHIPLELTQLTELTDLSLSSNDLIGPVPPELQRLAQLRFLRLGGNELSGTIPSELGQLANLNRLSLGLNSLNGPIPRELGQLGSLNWLHLGGNDLSGPIPSELGQLSQLQRLQLHHNRLTGTIPPVLGQLARLQHLYLHFNNLSGPIPPELGQLSQLHELILFRNRLTGSIPPDLGQLKSLWFLLLYDNDFSGILPKELGQLAELKHLDLSNNRLSGRIPLELGDLRQLERLYLSNNNFSDPIPPELGNLTQLRILYLNGNALSGPIPTELGDLSQLEWLNLNYNNLSGAIPPELGQLDKLQDLDLARNNLSGPIPTDLGRLAELRVLALDENDLSGSIPPELAQLDSLRWITLQDNRLSGSVPDLTGLEGLDNLNLDINQFLFADLLPNASLGRSNVMTYTTQDTIETQLTCSASEYFFTTPATAEGNQYQWHRNNEAIPGAQSDTLRLSIASDLDEYHATITNGALPDLTLISHRVSTDGADPCTTQQYANAADSTLLVDFFNRTHGSLLWHTHTGWLEEPVAQWYGITLDASGRVTDVNLPNNNLVGQLPLSQLDQLPHLRYLDVSGNEFSGTIPKGLGALTQLEYLDLSRNTLAGEIPKELAGQAPLRVLNVTGNQLVGAIPTELSQISTLQTFSVSANQLSGPVPAFTGLDQLDTLHVAQNAFLFMDLLPNASLTRLDDFVYAPQDSVETLLTRTASGFALTTAAKAVGNRYQWYRDDLLISGPQSDTLHVSATSDPAQYHATITNDRLPDLTLVSRKKGVHDGLTLTEADIPDDFLLHQSYPNPFAEATTVAFELGTPEHVRIVVYDLLGKAVATIADGQFTAGVHRVEFTGDQLASGQYMYHMEAGAYRATKFMSLVR